MAAETGKINKRTLGLFLCSDENWIGGVYYILNIIRAINYFPEKQALVRSVVLYNKNISLNIIKEIEGYGISAVPIHKINILRKLSYRAGKIIFRRNFLYQFFIRRYKIDTLYPLGDYSALHKKLPCKCIYWIYDFQHKFLAELFDEEERNKRDEVFGLIAEKAENIVVSSYDSEKHFKLFYPDSSAKLYVLQFVSIIDKSTLTTGADISEKYNIKVPYFIVSNQFWQHKNHFVILEAIKILKNQGIHVLVVFTGKETDFRNPEHIKKIKEFISNHSLNDQCKLLGFLSREDQLALMRDALAVIQPSKFEGWGTVVEDAKNLGKAVIASDIPVHREQLENSGHYFHPDKPEQLAELMNVLVNKKETFINYNYEKKILQFVENLINIFFSL